jgi:hypothetical protein
MQYSFDGDEIEGTGTKSLFSQTVVQGLKTGEADVDGDGHITHAELYDYTIDQKGVKNPLQRPSM